jgi:hypothetical protein
MALTINGVPVEKGQAYTTKQLGFIPNDVIRGYKETKKWKLLFVTIDYKYHNELHSDGIVHEPRNGKPLFDYGKIENPKPETHLFVRHCRKGEFLYIGEMSYAIRYDKNRNKLFIKDDRLPKSRSHK